ncbi:hypothetical protein GOP47_0011450 [Adiantum capillus-veneris]|uniref:Protein DETOXIFICATION n=1 Tax=Adiantum capillus-veneris TaxID=13818 RepID=A0A9D4UU12_ADICA|nr:hypothetical protein GOP47_0011450 [Adiantum capillus-veneris]
MSGVKSFADNNSVVNILSTPTEPDYDVSTMYHFSTRLVHGDAEKARLIEAACRSLAASMCKTTTELSTTNIDSCSSQRAGSLQEVAYNCAHAAQGQPKGTAACLWVESSMSPIPAAEEVGGAQRIKSWDMEGGNCPRSYTSLLAVHCPSQAEVAEELCHLFRNAMPLILAGLLLYPRGIISMYFLGHLGELELAGGALSIAFANITGYSVLYGLALGMEPICGQAYGAKQWTLMALTTKKAIMGLIWTSLPIAFLWFNMQRILLLCGQDESVTEVAGVYILYSTPDLAVHCVLHPLRIYLRSQNITIPLSICAALALPLHVLANILLVSILHMGVRGVALAAVWTNINMLMFLLLYLSFCHTPVKGIWSSTGWVFSKKDWEPLVKLAIPSCVLVCLEWWWYEFMIMLSGLLVEAKATVATMGILIQITALVYIFPSSLSLAVSTRVSNELGANRPAKARLAVMVASCCAVVLGFVAMAFTTTIRHTWGRMFTKDETILRLTAMALPIVGLCELGNSPQTTGCGVLRGSARPSLGVKINLASFYIIGMPVSIILVFGVGIGFVGLWLGLLAAQATCAISMLFVMMRTNWLVEAERSKGLTRMSGWEENAMLINAENGEFEPTLTSKDSAKADANPNLSRLSDEANLSSTARCGEEDGATQCLIVPSKEGDVH